MCDPTAIAIVQLGVGIYGAVAGEKNRVKEQNEAADLNKAASLANEREASKDITLLESQTAQSSHRTVYEADRAARSTQALMRVSAGEAGVGGISVEALLGDVDRKLGEFTTTQDRNLDGALDSLQREKVSGRTVAQGRISQVQPTSINPLAIGTAVAAEGLQFFAGQVSRNNQKVKPPTP